MKGTRMTAAATLDNVRSLTKYRHLRANYRRLSSATSVLSIGAGLISETVDAQLAWRLYETFDQLTIELEKAGYSREMSLKMRDQGLADIGRYD